MFSSHPSMAIAIPSEVWHEILRFSDVEDILVLEGTCRFLHGVISDRHFWLKRLQSSDQAHAPDLPPHIRVGSLAYRDVRDLVIRARKRFLSCTGSLPLRVSKEIIIPLGQANLRNVLGHPFGWGTDRLLVPGGEYFLMRWSGGYLQCWDVATKECLWTYPSILRDTSNAHEVLTQCCFACDVQTDGGLHVAIVREISGDEHRTLDILRFSREDKSLAVLFQAMPVQLDVFHGLPIIMKLYGDVAVVYTEGHAIVILWKEKRIKVITEEIFDALEIVDNFIIGVTNSYGRNSLVAIPLQQIRCAAGTHVGLADVSIASYRMTPLANWIVAKELSVCKFHWQEEEEREEIAIMVLGDVYYEQACCDLPVAEFFSFSFDDFRNSSAPTIRPIFTPLGRSRLIGSDLQFSTYSALTPPSQSGSMVLAFYDDRKHEMRSARALVTFVPDRNAIIRILDDPVIGGKPATFSLNVEFYSGAIHYVTMDLETVVIRYIN